MNAFCCSTVIPEAYISVNLEYNINISQTIYKNSNQKFQIGHFVNSILSKNLVGNFFYLKTISLYEFYSYIKRVNILLKPQIYYTSIGKIRVKYSHVHKYNFFFLISITKP